MGAGSIACVSTFDRVLGQELEHQLERKTVLIAQGEMTMPLSGGGRLQLEVERTAEALPRREPHALLMRAERRMDDQLHPAAFVEKSAPQRRWRLTATRPAPPLGTHVEHGLLRAPRRSDHSRR